MKSDTILKAIEALNAAHALLGNGSASPSDIGKARADCFTASLGLRHALAAERPDVTLEAA